MTAPGRTNPSSVLVRALVAYSVYEHGNEGGSATRIDLSLQPRSCTVQDNGRGMGLEREGYVVGLLEQLAVRRSEVALHGIGLAIIAMSCPRLVIESWRKGFLHTQSFAWGIAQGDVQSEPSTGATGTRVTLTIADDAPDIDSGQVVAQVELWRQAHQGLAIEVSCGG